MLGGAKQSHPISNEDLDKRIPQAETILKKVNKEDIETIIRDITPEEKFRTLPDELNLIYGIRTAVCMYLYFYELLVERTELKKEVDDSRARGGGISNAIQAKRKFISAYSSFVMASSITARCEKILRGKDRAKLAHLESPRFDLVAGNGIETDIGYALSYYVSALKSPSNEGNKLIENNADLIAVSADYWRAFALKAADIVKSSPPEIYNLIATTTFTHGKFSITGLASTDRQEAKIVTWAPVLPEEVIGDPDVTILMLRLCDMLAFYDSVLQKNPFVEFGGLIESGLIDGPPGTGKTTRMRMMMTRLAKRAEQVGLAYIFKSLTADQVKTEWYGKTSQLMAEFLRSVTDPTLVALLFVDDIDLLIAPSRDVAQGADSDIMKSLMDFFSGTGSNYRGSYMSWAATNKPTASDDAIRQRFVYRPNILGPQSWEDYSDLAFQELRDFAKTGLLKIGEGGYKPKSRPLPTKIADTFSPELLAKFKSKRSGTWEDMGRLCAELRKKDPRFTGRSVRNAIQVAKAKAADFDIPEEWFADPDKFRAKEWNERVAMVKALYKELTTDKIMMALEQQFETEQRYIVESHQKEVSTVAERMRINKEASETLR